MPHINTNNQIPGIRGLMEFRPQMGIALQKLAQALLVEDSPLSRFDRELIATYVSSKNTCEFCTKSHTAIAIKVGGPNKENLVNQVLEDVETAAIPEKLRTLLKIAGSVQKGGQFVSETEILKAKSHGATDQEIHDTVLIAAAFCMFNRYVDGLGAITPKDSMPYEMAASLIEAKGYVR